MNAIDADIISMMKNSLDEVRKNFIGLVIGNQAENFSAGANIFLLVMEAENKNWDNIKNIVKEFQEANMAVKYFEKPVVSMPSGLKIAPVASSTATSLAPCGFIRRAVQEPTLPNPCTMYVAPNSVSGRVVKTRIVSPIPVSRIASW
jgi:hypothetical protein